MEANLYVILGGIAVFGLGSLILWMRGLRRGLAEGEAKERARDAIKEIREAVGRGDDAEVQRILTEKANSHKP